METKRRRSIRLPGFDYSQAGAFFVTICANNKDCLFGQIADFRMQPNAIGIMVTECWNDLAEHYAFISLDTWAVMPNHLHGIIWFGNDNPAKKSLSGIVAAFKATSTSQARKAFGSSLKLWQRGFFEHIIRDECGLFRIREYINANPVNWALDAEDSWIALGLGQ